MVAKTLQNVKNGRFATLTIELKRGKWLGRRVNIKEATKQAKLYVGKSLTMHMFCFMLIDYAWIT